MERVDRTIELVCEAYGATNVEYFTFPSYISISLDCEGKTYTKNKRVRTNQFNFSKLEKLSKTFDEIIEKKRKFRCNNFKI